MLFRPVRFRAISPEAGRDSDLKDRRVTTGFDSVGASVWSLIQQPKTFAEIRDALLGIYEVDSAQLESDLQVLLGELSRAGMIEIQT